MKEKFELSDNFKLRNGELMIILLTLPVYFFFPLLTLPILVMYHGYMSKHKLLTILLISFVFGMVASTTKSISVEMTDIERYRNSYFKLVNSSSFGDVLFSSVITSGEINVLFISVNYLFTRLFPNYFPIVPMFWVTVTYFFSLLSYLQYAKKLQINRQDYVLYMVIVVLLGIPFYQTTETIKQCTAISIMAYSFVLKSQGRKISLLWLVISLLIHLSGLFLIPIYLFMSRSWVVRWFIPLFIFAFLLSFININDLITRVLGDYLGVGFKDRAELYSDYNWSLSRRYYVILVLYGLITLFLWSSSRKVQQKHKDSILYSNLIGMHILAFLILLINRSNVHNFVRYTLTYFPFYIFSVMQILEIHMPKKEKVFVWIGLVVFFAYSNYMLLILRTDPQIGYANSYMNNSLTDLLTSNCIEFFKFK